MKSQEPFVLVNLNLIARGDNGGMGIKSPEPAVMRDEMRRDLLKRLALIAVAGYLAPRAIRIDSARAIHVAGHGGQGCSFPPCNGGG